jgi:hypothetical protein
MLRRRGLGLLSIRIAGEQIIRNPSNSAGYPGNDRPIDAAIRFDERQALMQPWPRGPLFRRRPGFGCRKPALDRLPCLVHMGGGFGIEDRVLLVKGYQQTESAG